MNQYLKTLIKRLALQLVDNKTRLSARTTEHYKLVGTFINVDLNDLEEQAYFVQKVYTAVKGAELMLLSPVSRIYKKYRKEQFA